MGQDYISSLSRNSPFSIFNPAFLSGGGQSAEEEMAAFDPLFLNLLGLKDPNDQFTRGTGSSRGAQQRSSMENPFGDFDPRMIAELLIAFALMMQDQRRGGGGAPRSFGQQNWGGGGQVPGGWSGGGRASTAPAANTGSTNTGATNTGATNTGPSNTVQPGSVTPQPYQGGRELVPQQFGGGLTGIQESSGCGPLAAIGVARAFGKNPDIQQTFNLASQTGWNGAGMNGPGNYKALLEKIGIPARLEYGVNNQAIRDSVQGGKPVTISTAKHYFLASDYDPSTGKYFVGNSGTAMRAGNKWMSLDEIAALGGGINGVVYAG